MALSLGLLLSVQNDLHASSVESGFVVTLIECDDNEDENSRVDSVAIFKRIYGASKSQSLGLDILSEKRLRSACWAHAPPVNEN